MDVPCGPLFVRRTGQRWTYVSVRHSSNDITRGLAPVGPRLSARAMPVTVSYDIVN